MYNNKILFTKGFTLIEMIVVLAIIGILSSIFFNSGFSDVKRRNAVFTDTETISSLITDMQNRTTSFVEGANNVNNIGYGVYIDMNNISKVESFYKLTDDILSPADISQLNISKPSEDIILTNSDKITKICLNSCATFDTSSSSNLISDFKLAIYFIRPKQYAVFAKTVDGITYDSDIVAGVPIEKSCIQISSSDGKDSRHIDIYYIGQVSASYGVCQ